MIDVIIGSTELFLARSWTVLERVDVISACCRIIPVIGLSCVGGAVETEASSTGVSMCPVGTGGSSRGMIWPSGWLSSSKCEFLKSSTSSCVVQWRDRFLSSHLSDSSSSTNVSVNAASSAFLFTQRYRKRMISSIGGGSSSASNLSNISVSRSMVSRKTDKMEAGFLLVVSRNETARNGGRMWVRLMATFVLVVVLHLYKASHSFLFTCSEMFLKLGTSALKTAFPENQFSASYSIGMGVAELVLMRRPR